MADLTDLFSWFLKFIGVLCGAAVVIGLIFGIIGSIKVTKRKREIEQQKREYEQKKREYEQKKRDEFESLKAKIVNGKLTNEIKETIQDAKKMGLNVFRISFCRTEVIIEFYGNGKESLISNIQCLGSLGRSYFQYQSTITCYGVLSAQEAEALCSVFKDYVGSKMFKIDCNLSYAGTYSLKLIDLPWETGSNW